jgi:F0F1-type ATP synthase alpha subunit
MSTVLEQIEQQIAKLSSKAVKKNTGTIRTVADGVAKIDGLSDVMYNEMVQFPGGAIGIALNLKRTRSAASSSATSRSSRKATRCHHRPPPLRARRQGPPRPRG